MSCSLKPKLRGKQWSSTIRLKQVLNQKYRIDSGFTGGEQDKASKEADAIFRRTQAMTTCSTPAQIQNF